METFIEYWSNVGRDIGFFIVGILILFVGMLISDLFTGIGDKLFGKKKEQPSDQSH